MSKEFEEVKLSEWAKKQGISYKKAHAMFENNSLPVKTTVSKTGRISVLMEPESKFPLKTTFPVKESQGKFAVPIGQDWTKAELSLASRRNKASTSLPTDPYFHIDSGVTPFNTSNSDKYGTLINMSEQIKLCQKAYWNFSIIRNTIDIMTEFSTNKIYLRGGNKKSQNFFYDWMESINLLDFQDKFYRECYRSGNIPILKLEGEVSADDIKELNTVFGAKAEGKVLLPLKFIILNPADIYVQGTSLFTDSIYFKGLNSYEVARLQNPKTEADRALFNNLPEEVKKDIKSGSGQILLPLDPQDIYFIFYKKQDYEPMSVPIIFPVLQDINWKAEMKKIDMAVSRVMQNVVLLVKMGYESKTTGEYMVDQQAMAAMRQIFESESVGKTLVADFTTEVSFVIPTIGDFLDPKKYTIVNQDIKEGLNTILGGNDSKFANQYIQVQLFIQRLQQARELFLTKFLIPEIKRISKIMNFKSYPTPYFEEIDLKDDTEFSKLATRLAEIGLFTPEETFNAIETGRMPTAKESEESQEHFVELKKKGYYEPIMGGPSTQKDILDTTNKQAIKMQDKQFEHDAKEKGKDRKHAAENPQAPAPQIVLNAPTKMGQPKGKPTGKTGTQSKTRKSSPMKASQDFWSLDKLTKNLTLLNELNQEIESELLKKNNIKELTAELQNIKSQISEIIVSNNEPKDWKENLKKYLSNPINDNPDRLGEIDDIALDHNISPYAAAILLASKKEDNA